MEPNKDPDNEYRVPDSWRPAFEAVVTSFRAGDYFLATPIDMVEPIASDVAEAARAYVTDYGEELIDLPEEAWATSVVRWMGEYWDVLVDLWTEDEGESDLVLSARVFESAPSYRIRINGVYVP